MKKSNLDYLIIFSRDFHTINIKAHFWNVQLSLNNKEK